VRRAALSAGLLLVAILVQLTLFDNLRLPGGAGPDLVLVVVVALALTGGPMEGVLGGFCAGLALDVAPPATHLVGQYALVFCLVGYAAGFPLRPSTSWWRRLTTTLPEEVTAEHPGRTFAVVDLGVRASWRRQGIGAALHDLVLAKRPEERATLMAPPAATPAQAALRNWGWHKVARTRDSGPGSPVSDVLVLTLPATR